MVGEACLASCLAVLEVRESATEKKFRLWCTDKGILCLKVQFMTTGYPDRVCILPSGLHIWIEFKARGKKPRVLQLHRMWELRDQGALVGWTDELSIAIEATDELLRNMHWLRPAQESKWFSGPSKRLQMQQQIQKIEALRLRMWGADNEQLREWTQHEEDFRRRAATALQRRY
jgi:hypothetical protein